MADQFTPTPIKTKANGDVVIKLVDTGGTNVAAVSAANALKVDGSAVTQPVSGTITTTPSGTQNVNTAQVNGVTVLTGTGATGTGSQRVTVAVDSATVAGSASLPTGSNVIGALVANQSVNNVQLGGNTISTGNGVVGTGVQRVAVASDNTPFAVKTDQTTHGTTDLVAADITKVNGTASSVTNGLFTRLTDGTNPLGTGSNPLAVTFEGNAGGTLVDSGNLTSASVAAGATATLTGAAVTTGTAKFLQLTASSSVRTKVELQKFVGAVATTVRTFFVDANQSLSYDSKDRDAITFSGAAGNLFQLKVTNMDNALAADVYGSITQENV